MAKTAAALALVLALAASCLAQGEEPFRPWEPVGPGGGGGNFRAAISPYDSELYFAACDMGGFYRSDDAGASWRMIEGISHTTMAVVFDPADPDVCYVGHHVGAFMNNGWAFSTSTDRGETWSELYSFIGAYETNAPVCLAIDPDETSRMWLGMSGALGGRILRSRTGGRSWAASDAGIPPKAVCLAIYVLQAAKTGGRELCAITDVGPYRSLDDGFNWTPSANGLPEGKRIVAWTSSYEPIEGQTTLFVATEIEPQGGRLSGGVYRSADGAMTWARTGSPVDQAFIGSKGARSGSVVALAANDDAADVLYSAVHLTGEPYQSGIWKSTDGGVTWVYVLLGGAEQYVAGEKPAAANTIEIGWLEKVFGWGWGGPPNGQDQLAACKTDPDVVLRQDDGRTIGTRDGGATWLQLYTDHVEGERWTSRGYEVTTCYKVYWNPSDHNKMFIAYTDIGFFRSADRGKSWTYAIRGSKHTNTVYDLAIDPAKPDTMFAAVSSNHDMPEWKTLISSRTKTRGGVAMTADGGKSWKPMGEDGGLPNSSVGRIILDPGSPADKRTLYAVCWGYGVYKSADGGGTWVQSNKGIDAERDYDFWRMDLARDGALYLITTKTITLADGKYTFGPGALYRSDDAAANWTLLMRGDWMSYPYDVVCDPADSNVVYVATKADPHVESPVMTRGGLWKSSDRGRTWTRILAKDGPQRITVDPADTKVIYVSTEDSGVYRTGDGGTVWNNLQGPPFRNVIGVSIDPDDRGTLYLSTFGGGVWKGSALGGPFRPEDGFAIDRTP